ncbi:hypothetical protein CYLTODRAFT_221380 [Cylindrobasidium torrendii FP15055 ss-10]|uniref:Uncharacterized protein n=1 Tax=Cylindrobasidium torrendii FP15055 ss-10 TaxID=1314674 RepID=A0A0D7BHJ2_9AGAR|nr:hypothetical protein CYLTODRAFT_221380 [Cylindrobasidium torrendii FP15055 ss-10]
MLKCRPRRCAHLRRFLYLVSTPRSVHNLFLYSFVLIYSSTVSTATPFASFSSAMLFSLMFLLPPLCIIHLYLALSFTYHTTPLQTFSSDSATPRMYVHQMY